MFNYIKETIINSEKTFTKSKDNKELIIFRGANYKFDNICNKRVFKTTGHEGKFASITLAQSILSSITTGGYAQYRIFVSTPSKELGEHGLANWHEFGKPIMIESGATTIADLILAFELARPNDNPFYKVSNDSGVKLTFDENWFHVEEVTIDVFDAKGELTSTKSWIADGTKKDAGITVEQNVEEFATANWIVENLRFPSTANLRYNHLYADESPIRGAIYDQYTFEYYIKHSTPGGVSGVGQVVDSITTHTFYVLHDEANKISKAFEDLLTEVGLEISPENGLDTTETISKDDVLDSVRNGEEETPSED